MIGIPWMISLDTFAIHVKKENARINKYINKISKSMYFEVAADLFLVKHFLISDEKALTKLSSLKIIPSGGPTAGSVMEPSFDPRVTSYKIAVPYDAVEVTMFATATYCQAEARFEDKFGPTGLVYTRQYHTGLFDLILNL